MAYIASTYDTNPFSGLFGLDTSTGALTVIPDYAEVRAAVSGEMKRLFGQEFTDEPQTTNGLLIDVMAMVMYDCAGISAQTVNFLNVDMAFGKFLDAIGAVYGVPRNDGEDDETYRTRLKDSFARGIGMVDAVRNAIANINGVKAYVVLENCTSHQMYLPAGERHFVNVGAHSIFVCVKTDGDENTNEAVCDAIVATRSLGCGMSVAEDAESYVGSDGLTSISLAKTFPNIKVIVNVNSSKYVGSETVKSVVEDAVKKMFKANCMNYTFSEADVISSVARNGNGIVAKWAEILVVGDSNDYEETTYLSVMPWQWIDSENGVEVELA